MDFIALDEALDALAASINGDDEAEKYSRVAAELHLAQSLSRLVIQGLTDEDVRFAFRCPVGVYP